MDILLLAAILFVVTTFLTVYLVYNIFKRSSHTNTQKLSLPVVAGIMAWLVVQALITIAGLYYNSIHKDVPPKILLFGIAPMLAVILLLFVTPRGRHLIDNLHLKSLTWLHVIRVPVEIGLYLLFTLKAIPELMTFEGRNFDVISGLTAPVIAYYGFTGKAPNKKLLIGWNLVCLILLFNIVINALLSVPSPMQRQAFDQPNVAVLQFPFSWLPVFIVPAVLFSHLVALRQLVRMK
jgi:uncharacterized membrane protein